MVSALRLAARIEREEDLLFATNALKLVHPIGNDAATVGIVADIIPARPKRLAARHEGGVGVEHGAILCIAECAQ